MIDRQNLDGGPPDCCDAQQHRALPAEVRRPHVLAGIEQPGDSFVLRIAASEVWAL